jgi:hypothetical protein
MMLANLLRRGEQLANEVTQKKVAEVAGRLRSTFGAAAISIEDSRVVISGRGVIRRWLTDPALRFIGWGIK